MDGEDTGYLYELLVEIGLTDFQAKTAEFLLVRPLRLVVILLVAFLVARVGGRVAARLVRSVQLRAPEPLRPARLQQRSTTIAEVIAKMWRGVVWSVALLVLLGEVGIDVAPLIAGAGIAGVALGFGAQSLVRDFLSGLFILLEDQYGVGDVVRLSADATGTIEDVSLRVTRVRSVDGTVWFVPNGEIRQVGNRSMGWSRALVDVVVPLDTDLDRATDVLREEAAALADDPRWRDGVLEPPEVWGVEGSTADGVTIRLVVKTAPGRQREVVSALRHRLAGRLRSEGIAGHTPA